MDFQNSRDSFYAELKSRKQHTTTTNMADWFCVCPWYCNFICCSI